MRTYLPKILPFLVALVAFSFFSCSNPERDPGASSSSSEPNEPSSSSFEVVPSSSAIIAISSSSLVASSSSVATYSSSEVYSSSSAEFEPSSSAESSSSATTASSSSSVRLSSSSAKSGSSSSMPIVPFEPISCTRTGLEAAVNTYLAAIAAGDYTKMPLATGAKYYENDNSAKQNYSTGKYDKEVAFGDGLWKTPIKPDFHRNLIDVQECATFTEIIVANTNPQYVFGARLKVKENKISEVSLVVTKDGDWGFNAKSYLSASSSKREDTVWVKPGYIGREELRAAAYAYFAYFGDKTVEVPWGIPCTRVEGGMSTGDSPTSTCNVGVPDVKVDPKGITYLADVDYGMVVLFLYFGGADSHMFKILPSPTRYRYIHTLTAMKQSDFKP